MKKNKKTLSLVIPMYNEAERLTLATRAILAGFISKQLKLNQIIFVNDGSTDKTLAKLKIVKRNIEKKTEIKVVIVSYEKNKGKGYAVRQGMRKANGDYALLADVDMSTPLTEINKVDDYISQGANVIVGTRKNGESTVVIAQPMYRQIMGKAFTKLTQILLGMRVSDFTCGFKLFSRKARSLIFENAQINRWGYDAEILYIAQLNGFKTYERALLWYNDNRSRVNVLRDTFQSIKELMLIKTCGLRGIYTSGTTRDNLIKKGNSWVKSISYS